MRCQEGRGGSDRKESRPPKKSGGPHPGDPWRSSSSCEGKTLLRNEEIRDLMQGADWCKKMGETELKNESSLCCRCSQRDNG
jgi:hypothetical protein